MTVLRAARRERVPNSRKHLSPDAVLGKESNRNDTNSYRKRFIRACIVMHACLFTSAVRKFPRRSIRARHPAHDEFEISPFGMAREHGMIRCMTCVVDDLEPFSGFSRTNG